MSGAKSSGRAACICLSVALTPQTNCSESASPKYAFDSLTSKLILIGWSVAFLKASASSGVSDDQASDAASVGGSSDPITGIAIPRPMTPPSAITALTMKVRRVCSSGVPSSLYASEWPIVLSPSSWKKLQSK